MHYEPWMFAAMEEEGVLDTREGRINRVANYFRDSSYTHVGNEEFIEACHDCDVDPYAFTDRDIAEIERKANR